MSGAEEVEFVVVGAGSAGCCLANRLSADRAHRVLLVEAGGPDTHPLIKMGLGFSRLMYDPKFSNVYATEPEPHLGGRRVHLVRGRVLGGSSSINGQVYMRGQREDYDEWAALPGCAGWSFAELLPYFRRSEHFEAGPAGPYHGHGGELNVTLPSWDYPVTQVYREAAEEYGLPWNPDLNGPAQLGIGPVHVNQKGRQRWSSADAFLGPAVRARDNLRLALRTRVARVVVEGGRAAAVELVPEAGSARTVRVTREVILAAGAYDTPPLLERSGIGAPAVLRALGVPVVHALPGVGENLQDHFQTWVQMGVRGFATLGDEGKFPRVLWNALRYFAAARGPLTFPACNLGAFIPARGSPRPMFQIHFSPGAGHQDEHGNMVASVEPGVNVSVTFLRPTSRGSVHAASADPAAFPRVLHRYLATEHDRALALEGFQVARAIFATPRFAAIATRELMPGDSVRTDADVLRTWEAEGKSVYHPVGSASMGADDDPAAVVDSALRVHGVAGLRVADASILPRVPSGNTHAPVVAVAERAADLILGRTPLAPEPTRPQAGSAPRGASPDRNERGA